MKCFSHADVDARAVCANCGKGLCQPCAQRTIAGKIACSGACGDAITRQLDMMEMYRSKFLRSHELLGYWQFIFAAIFLVPAIYCFQSADWHLALFLAALAAVFMLGGFWSIRLSKGGKAK